MLECKKGVMYMRVDFRPYRVIQKIKMNATTPLDENMFVLPTTSVDSFVKSNDIIGAKLRSLVSKISEIFKGIKGKNKPDINEKTSESIEKEASRILEERKAIYSVSGEREKLNKEIKELIDAKPELSKELSNKAEVQKLLAERKKHVKDYEITHYADIRLKKDLYKRQLEYLGLEVTEIPKEIQLNYDLAYWKDRLEKAGSGNAIKEILRIETEMEKYGILERKLSEVETLKAKYLDELKIYNCCERRIARVKEIDARLAEIQENFKNKEQNSSIV